jgi:hypothetical protein
MAFCDFCTRKRKLATGQCRRCHKHLCAFHLERHPCQTGSDDSDEGELDSDDQDFELGHEKKRLRKRAVDSSSESSQEDVRGASSESEVESDVDSDDGGAMPSSPPEPPPVEYYSSDDDETPEDRTEWPFLRFSARREFDATVAFLRALQQHFNGLSGHEQVQKALAVLSNSSPAAAIFPFEAAKLYPTIKYRDRIAAQQQGHEFHISTPAQWLALAELLRDSRYRPCDIIIDLWPKATRNRMCIRGGNSLISPYSGMARTWPSLALKLHDVACMLGEVVCAAVLGQKVSPKGVERMGHQLLAAIMLRVYRGQGAEVFDYLVGRLKLTSEAMEVLEEFLSEFLALSFGVESERLFLTHFETLLHLENIANGFRYGLSSRIRCSRGGTPSVVGQHLFNFLNIFSGIREIGGQNRHVYVPAEMERTSRGKERDVTAYKGFALEKDIQNALRFKDSKGRTKSKRSRGKSMVAGGAGFFHLKPFLGGKNKKGEPYRDFTTQKVIEGVWNQLRPVAPGEDRNAMHAERLEYMACIRIYNTVANFARRHADKTTRNWERRFIYQSHAPAEDASALMDWLRHLLFSPSSPPVETPWAGSLPMLESSLDFAALVDQLLEQAFPQHLGKKALPLDKNHVYRWLGFCRASDLQFLTDRSGEKQLLPGAWKLEPRKSAEGWLGNAHMGELILHHLEGMAPAAALVSPVDVDSNWWDMTSSIIESLEAQSISPQGVSPFLVCPINLGNQHWACFVIELNRQDLSAPTVYFFDSLGSTPQKLDAVRRIVQDTLFLSHPLVVDLSAGIQADGYTCGTWMLEALRLILQLRLSGVDLCDVQHFQAELQALEKDIGTRHEKNLELEADYAKQDHVEEELPTDPFEGPEPMEEDRDPFSQ